MRSTSVNLPALLAGLALAAAPVQSITPGSKNVIAQVGGLVMVHVSGCTLTSSTRCSNGPGTRSRPNVPTFLAHLGEWKTPSESIQSLMSML
jgi:hypothetical protein